MSKGASKIDYASVEKDINKDSLKPYPSSLEGGVMGSDEYVKSDAKNPALGPKNPSDGAYQD
jgi:hypothetical protein